MKKRNFLIGMVGISLALGMMVIGCDQDGDSGGGGGPGRVSGTQVYLSDGTEYTGSGTVKVSIYYSTGTGYGSSGTYETAVGSITDGKLSFTLPKPDEQYLSPPENIFGESTTVKGEDIKVAPVEGFTFIDASTGKTGSLSSNKGYFYFNKACSISGTDSNGAASSASFHSGWNEFTSSSRSDKWTVTVY
jgi:hypothetical protein